MAFATLSHDEVLELRAHIEKDFAIPHPEVRKQIEDDIAAFLARGGVIEQAESKQLRCVVPDYDPKCKRGEGTIRRRWVDTPQEFSFVNFQIKQKGKAA